jgi:type IV pilus assembly protein PilQ
MKTSIVTVALLLIVTAGGLSADPMPSERRLTLQLEGVPLVDALGMIAEQNGLNLVVSGEVTGDVTIRLDDVDIATALDAILTAGGYNYFLRDSVIIVKPLGLDVSGELESRTIRLKYVDPVTAKKALESRISDKGKVIVLDKMLESGANGGPYQPNRIVITDRASNLNRLVELVQEIDVPERLIQIEAKIIETKLDDISKLGFIWPSQLSASMTGADNGTGSDGSSDILSTLSNRNAGVYDPNNGSWTWGKLSVDEANLILDFLMTSGNSKLISDPRITTVENHEAEIKIETVIPIQTINRFSEGAVIQDIVSFQDEAVGISLRVTPRINEADKLTLEVSPTVEDIIGFTGPADNQRPITIERSVLTRISVNDGETVALGGLFKEDEIKSEQKVPILGHIPLLGKLLFTHHSKQKTTTDLIILITPKILN